MSDSAGLRRSSLNVFPSSTLSEVWRPLVGPAACHGSCTGYWGSPDDALHGVRRLWLSGGHRTVMIAGLSQWRSKEVVKGGGIHHGSPSLLRRIRVSDTCERRPLGSGESMAPSPLGTPLMWSPTRLPAHVNQAVMRTQQCLLHFASCISLTLGMHAVIEHLNSDVLGNSPLFRKV